MVGHMVLDQIGGKNLKTTFTQLILFLIIAIPDKPSKPKSESKK